MLCGLTAKAQWSQTLTGQGSLINAISVVNDNVVWIKDQLNTKISITTDGGATWVNKALPTAMSGKVGGFSAVNATTAYMVLSMASTPYIQGMYKTTNSGDSWEKQTTGFNANSSFPDFVYFWNENEGVAVGDAYPDTNFEIYTTSNGGLQWNLVSAANMPTSNNEWSYNTNNTYKVVGNSIFFQTSSGRIFKSVNHGMAWTVITTPITSGDKMSFDFKDENNGLLSNYTASTGLYSLYSTNTGGANWTKIVTSSAVADLKYIPAKEIYVSTHYNFGLMYSSDNGLTWTTHPSFVNPGLKAVGYGPSGKIFMGGWSYFYSSSNYSALNLAVSQTKIINSKAIDITFSQNLDVTTAQDTANYILNHRLLKNASNAWIYNRIKLISATIDNTNKSLVHLITVSDLPYDTIYANTFNVKGLDGFSIINKSSSSISNVINYKSLTNYSSTKIALIGNSYFIDNVKGGPKANWNTCWMDAANNVQASVPAVSGNGLVYTWSFPNVYLDGANQGMFKFCIPNTDNTPDWGKITIGFPQINEYAGDASSDVDRITDGGGAFIILTSGSTKRYNIKLIADQTSGIEKMVLSFINNNNTAITSINDNEVVIAEYRIYSVQGALISSGSSVKGFKLDDLKTNLNKGIYLINAKLMNGENRSYKIIGQ